MTEYISRFLAADCSICRKVVNLEKRHAEWTDGEGRMRYAHEECVEAERYSPIDGIYPGKKES